MSNYIIEIVSSKKHAKEFLELPKRMYRGDENYVTPLDSDIEKVFNPSINKMFDGGEAIRYLVKDADKGEYVGRIAAFYNNNTANQGEDMAGGCGFFESINSQEVANLLFDTSIEWLKGKGMTCVDGPINFGDREVWWGLLSEGFTQPIYGMTYNFPYYQELFENYGFMNYFNGMSYKRTLVATELNPIVVEKARRLSENEDYCFRHVKKSELDDAADWFYDIYRKAWANFEGIASITEEQAQKLMGNLKPIIDEKLIYFAFYKGEPVGFFINIPDLNPIIKPFGGKFGLLNKLRFVYRLKHRKVTKVVQGLIFGVVPEFRGKGIESGMMYAFTKSVEDGIIDYDYMELTWVGDFNPLMMNMVRRYVCAKKIKNHITYRYNFDRER